jgi:hypothetical protein
MGKNKLFQNIHFTGAVNYQGSQPHVQIYIDPMRSNTALFNMGSAVTFFNRDMFVMVQVAKHPEPQSLPHLGQWLPENN